MSADIRTVIAAAACLGAKPRVIFRKPTEAEDAQPVAAVRARVAPRFNRIGERYGDLVIIGDADSTPSGGRRYQCLCDCGNTKEITFSNLRDGRTISCGCRMRTSNLKHGGCDLPEYKIWRAMKTRCFNPKHEKFPLYGKRGITVCDRWRSSFENFLADMGQRPSVGHSIDRINNDGNYEPGNCRWATAVEQRNNRSDSRRRSAA